MFAKDAKIWSKIIVENDYESSGRFEQADNLVTDIVAEVPSREVQGNAHWPPDVHIYAQGIK